MHSPAQMSFQYLTDIHSGRYAQRIQHNLYRCTIRQERHIFLAHNAGNDTFITMTAGHLIPFMDFTFLGNVYTDETVDARRQFIIIFTGENTDIDNFTGFTMRHTQRCITDFPFFITENSAQEPFFRSQFRFSLWRDLAYQDIPGEYVGTDHDDAVFVKVLRAVFADIRYFAGNFFRSQFRIAGIAFVFFDVDGCI